MELGLLFHDDDDRGFALLLGRFGDEFVIIVASLLHWDSDGLLGLIDCRGG